MFGSRRLAKRSIIGTKVCGERQDGRYYQGTIQAIQAQPNDQEFYSVVFPDGESTLYRDSDLIGPGFQNITIAKLREGQRIYATNNGREVEGRVCEHESKFTDVVTIAVLSGLKEVVLERPLDELRLMESRKSARLQDSHDTDYSKLASSSTGAGDAKKRTVSHVIDVPAPTVKHSRRRKASPDLDEMFQDDQNEARAAAMVLTSLSCSPLSPKINLLHGMSSPGTSSSFASSGIFPGSDKSSPYPSIPGSSSPSPPSLVTSGHISCSAPGGLVFTPSSSNIDEGIDLDSSDQLLDYYEDSKPKRKRKSMRTVYQCTWRTCKKICNTVTSIERHIRQAHLPPKESSGSDSELSDHEEEFYYTEVDVSVDTVTRTFADMHTSSPPDADPTLLLDPVPKASPMEDVEDPDPSPLLVDDQPTTDNRAEYDTRAEHVLPSSLPTSTMLDIKVTQAEAQALDHDYQRKDLFYSTQRNLSAYPYTSTPSYPTSLPVQIPVPENLSKSLSWQVGDNQIGQPQVTSPIKYGRSYQHSQPISLVSPRAQGIYSGSGPSSFLSGSPKSSPLHYKKSRSDVKKCRKVYGMENRDMWCTQCKWKKACTRFSD